MNVTKRIRIVLVLTSLLGGAGIGLLSCFLLFPLHKASVQSQTVKGIELPSQPIYEEHKGSDSGPQALDEIIELAKPTEVRPALYQLLKNKSGSQVADLIRSTLLVESTENLYRVQRILFSELTRLDSEEALELIWETDRVRWGTLLDIVATQWSTIAPREALRAFSTLAEPWKGKAIQTVLNHQGSLSEEELADVAESINITDYVASRVLDVELVKVLDEPRKAFNLVLAADVSDFQKQTALKMITRRWIERESAENIGSMLSLVDELFSEAPYFLWQPLVVDIAASNPTIAWNQLMSLPEDTQQVYRTLLFRALAAEDPINAIHTITSDDYMESMKSEVRYLLTSWVQALSGQVLEHIELVPEDFRSSVVREAVYQIADDLPPDDVLDLLAQFRQLGINTLDATISFVTIWSRKDPATAVQWTLENIDLDNFNGRWLLGHGLGELALSDSAKAMEIALNQPVENAAEDDVVLALLRQGRIDEGMALLPQIRDAVDPYVYSRVSDVLIEAGRIEDALAIGEALMESAKSSFYRRLALPWIRFDAESLMEKLPQMENKEIRSMIATGLLQWDEYLSEEEYKMVSTFVLDESNQ